MSVAILKPAGNLYFQFVFYVFYIKVMETLGFPLVKLKYLDHNTPQRFCMRACLVA